MTELERVTSRFNEENIASITEQVTVVSKPSMSEPETDTSKPNEEKLLP